MKHKVAELEGALLDAAVSIAEGSIPGRDFRIETGQMRRYSECWSEAGPIIERERMLLGPPSSGASMYDDWGSSDGGSADAFKDAKWWARAPNTKRNSYGPTPLIAAMRAFVASKFGEEVELPHG